MDRPELSGSLFSVEFGASGRVQQLWVGDPNHADAEEFQFVAPPISMGDEATEDYFPGTILLAVRTDPGEPWISSRNINAELLDDQNGFLWEYEFPFLEDLQVRGFFEERPHPMPHLVWEIELRNRSRRSIEIGELGFPMAFNNVLEGYNRTDQSQHEMYQDRVHVHRYVGGAASYLFAQRLNGRSPGLLVMPGEKTQWEFTNNVPASLATPLRWEGIPIVYVHSLATVEREEWGEWFNGHSSRIVEPGENLKLQLLFMAGERDQIDHVSTLQGIFGLPSISVYPSAVAPVDVGIGLEIVGSTPTQFDTDVECEMETDSDEEGGFCFVRPSQPGAVTLSFVDTLDRSSRVHLLFTEPIDILAVKRAAYITSKQVVKSGTYKHAILGGDHRSEEPLDTMDAFSIPFGIESSFAEAIFLSEKNRHIPDASEIRILDRHLRQFVEEFVVNPGDGSVGSTLPSPNGIAAGFGRARTYPLAVTLYLQMARLAESVGGTERSATDYARRAYRVAIAMFRFASPSSLGSAGVPLIEEVFALAHLLWRLELQDEAQQLGMLLGRRADELCSRQYPFAGSSLWSADAFVEVAEVARKRGQDDLAERATRFAFAGRGLAPSWWWYGSDKRWAEDPSGHPSIYDKGELCIGPTSVGIARLALSFLEHDAFDIPEAYVRSAFGGLLAPWALVRSDGAGSLGYTPDMASGQYGMNAASGDLGLSLYQYMRTATSYVLPTRQSGTHTLLCHLESETRKGEDFFTVRPWDGVGRRVVVRQIGIEAEISFGRILDLRFGARKRKAGLRIKNPATVDLPCRISISGLWGSRFQVGESVLESETGEFIYDVMLPKASTITIEVEVI